MPKCPKCMLYYSGKLPRCPGCGNELPKQTAQNEAADSESQTIQDLFAMARSISSTLDLDALLKKIGTSAERLLDCVASSIMLKVEGLDQLYFKTATGEKSQEVKLLKVPIGKGIAGWVAKEKKPLIINDVDADERFTRDFDKASGFHTRSILCVPMVMENDLIGVVEVLNKSDGNGFNQNDLNLLSSLAGLAAVAVTNAKLVENQKNFFTNVIELLVTAIEMKDTRIKGHSYRVAQLACAIGKKLGMDENEYKLLYYAATLHDIGILGVSCDGFTASSQKTAAEVSYYRMHALIGSEMVKGINMLAGAAPIIRLHHAYIDGSGINDSLKGDDIPLGSRILSLLEDVEEIRLKGLPSDLYFEAVEKQVKQGSGKKYDARVVKIFLEENKMAKDAML